MNNHASVVTLSTLSGKHGDNLSQILGTLALLSLI